MKSAKYVPVFMLMICMIFPIFSRERIKPMDIKELTNQSSPSYAPHPYPKKRKEIIADMLYAIKKLYAPKKGQYLTGERPPTIRHLFKFA